MTADSKDLSYRVVSVFRHEALVYGLGISGYSDLLLRVDDTPTEYTRGVFPPLQESQRMLFTTLIQQVSGSHAVWNMVRDYLSSTCVSFRVRPVAVADILEDLQKKQRHAPLEPTLDRCDHSVAVCAPQRHLSPALNMLLYPVEFALCKSQACVLSIERSADHVILRLRSAIDMTQQRGLAAVCADWSSVDIARRMIQQYGGGLSIAEQDGLLICTVSLPIAKADEIEQEDEPKAEMYGSIPEAMLQYWQPIERTYCASILKTLDELMTSNGASLMASDVPRQMFEKMIKSAYQILSMWNKFNDYCFAIQQQPQAGQTTVAAILAVTREQLGRFGAALALDAPTPAAHVPGDAERLGRALAYLLYPFEYEMHEPSRCALSIDALPDQIVFHITSGVHLQGMMDIWLPPYDDLSISPARVVIALYGGTVSIDLRGDMLHATVYLPLAAG